MLTLAILKEILPVSKSLTENKIGGYIADAEKIVAKTISQQFFDELSAYVPPALPALPDPLITKAISLLNESSAYLAFYLGFDIMNAHFSDQGIHRIENEQSGKRSLFQRQEIELKNTFKRTGFNKLDEALEFLEKNKTNFPTWTASEEYTLSRENFINSAKDFNKIFNINSSRLVFLKLRPAQTLAEDLDIEPLIGMEFFAELKAQIAADSVSAANLTFLPYLQKAVVHSSIYRGGYELLADLNEYGMFQVEQDAANGNQLTQKQLRDSIFEKIIDRSKHNARAYISACEQFLRYYILDYPTYANSSAYNADASLYTGIKGTDKIIMM
jgi:hypothetical protein